MTDDLKNKILAGLQELLDKRFGNESAKLNIKNRHDYISIACPYCGDSLKISSKKRGTVYINTYQYKCFNCGTYKRLDKFFKDFEIDIKDPNFIANAVKSNVSKNVIDFSNVNTTLKEYYKDFFVIELNDLINKEGLISGVKIPFVNEYLNSRKIPKEKIEKYFYYSIKENCIFILNIVDYNNKQYVFGITKHNFRNSNKKYLIFSFNKLLEMFNIDLKGFKNYDKFVKLCSYFGLFNIDFKKPVFVVEGLIDSMFLNNSIALSGVTKNIEFLDKNNIYYIFDNDEIGIKVGKEKIKKGCNVFVWKKYLSETGLNKYHIKDVNDIYKVVAKYGINKEKVDIKYNTHFSKNVLDSFWIN